jgi:hypothetical protein
MRYGDICIVDLGYWMPDLMCLKCEYKGNVRCSNSVQARTCDICDIASHHHEDVACSIY